MLHRCSVLPLLLLLLLLHLYLLLLLLLLMPQPSRIRLIISPLTRTCTQVEPPTRICQAPRVDIGKRLIDRIGRHVPVD